MLNTDYFTEGAYVYNNVSVFSIYDDYLFFYEVSGLPEGVEIPLTYKVTVGSSVVVSGDLGTCDNGTFAGLVTGPHHPGTNTITMYGGNGEELDSKTIEVVDY